MLVQFVIVEPESKRGRHTVRLPLLVGRSREAKFRIQQERVSRRHCEFFVEDGVVYIRDLGSTNGTHLEGRPVLIDPPTRVPPGTLIHVGSLGFVVEYDRFAHTPTIEIRPELLSDPLPPEAPEATGDDHVDILFGGDNPPSSGRRPPGASVDPEPASGGETEDQADEFFDGLG